MSTKRISASGFRSAIAARIAATCPRSPWSGRRSPAAAVRTAGRRPRTRSLRASSRSSTIPWTSTCPLRPITRTMIALAPGASRAAWWTRSDQRAGGVDQALSRRLQPPPLAVADPVRRDQDARRFAAHSGPADRSASPRIAKPRDRKSPSTTSLWTSCPWIVTVAGIGDPVDDRQGIPDAEAHPHHLRPDHPHDESSFEPLIASTS